MDSGAKLSVMVHSWPHHNIMKETYKQNNKKTNKERTIIGYFFYCFVVRPEQGTLITQ